MLTGHFPVKNLNVNYSISCSFGSVPLGTFCLRSIFQIHPAYSAKTPQFIYFRTASHWRVASTCNITLPALYRSKNLNEERMEGFSFFFYNYKPNIDSPGFQAKSKRFKARPTLFRKISVIHITQVNGTCIMFFNYLINICLTGKYPRNLWRMHENSVEYMYKESWKDEGGVFLT